MYQIVFFSTSVTSVQPVDQYSWFDDKHLKNPSAASATLRETKNQL